MPLLVREIEGPKTVQVGERASYRVSAFNRPDPTAAEIQAINWLVQADGTEVERRLEHGDSLTIDIPEELAGKQLLVMAFFRNPTPALSAVTLVRPGTAGQILRAGLGALRRDATDTQAEPSTDKVVSEALAKEHGEPLEPRPSDTAAETLEYMARAQRIIKDLDSKSEEQERNLRRRLATAEKLNAFAVMGLKFAAVMTLALAVVGIGCVGAGLVEEGMISGALAILPGSGTAIFWRLSKNSDETIERLAKDRQKAIDLFVAIQTTSLVDATTERDAAIARLLKQLTEPV